MKELQPTEISDAINALITNLKQLGFSNPIDIGSLEFSQGLNNIETWKRLFGNRWIERYYKTFFLLIECFLLEKAIFNWLEPKLLASQTYLTPEQAFAESTIQIPSKNIQHSRGIFLINNKSPDLMDDVEYLVYDNNNLDFPINYYPNIGEYLSFENVCYLLFKGYQEEVFRYRTGQTGAEILLIEEKIDPDYRTSKANKLNSLKSLLKKSATDKVLAYLYSSPNILSLAWVEIMWAIMNGVYAHTCDICGGVFRLEGRYHREAYICPNRDCQLTRRVEKMGGVEKLKEYNRNAKSISRKNLNNGIRRRKTKKKQTP